jgi:hypothetical protein
MLNEEKREEGEGEVVKEKSGRYGKGVVWGGRGRRRAVYCKLGLINYKDTKTKCRLYWRLVEFIEWRYSQSCWYFRPNFEYYCPSNLLTGSSPPCPTPPPPLPKVKAQNIQTVAGIGEGVVVLCWRLYSEGVQHSVSDKIQNLQNLPHQTKT